MPHLKTYFFKKNSISFGKIISNTFLRESDIASCPGTHSLSELSASDSLGSYEVKHVPSCTDFCFMFRTKCDLGFQ